MTERPVVRSSSAGRLARLWMVLAILSVGGLFGWLAVNAPIETVAVVEEEDAGEELDLEAAVAVAVDELASNPQSYMGRAIKLQEIAVSSRLGEHAFWTQTSQGIPFLVKLDKSLVEEGFTIQDGERVTVVGQVKELTSFVLDGWEMDGVLQTEEDRMVAEFATEYLDALRVTRSDGGTSAADN